MLPQWVLTLRGWALFTGLWEKRGGGGQKAGITEVTPPCLEPGPACVVSMGWWGGWCCQPVIEVRCLDWYPCLAVLCQASYCCLVILVCLTTCLFVFFQRAALCFSVYGWVCSSKAMLKCFWIASSELPLSYFRSCCYYDGALRLLSKLPNDAFMFIFDFLKKWVYSNPSTQEVIVIHSIIVHVSLCGTFCLLDDVNE